tara:strand:- start:1281 stop:2525 length:1245 start_codon:yes stop_codon:yes gene_type:complete
MSNHLENMKIKVTKHYQSSQLKNKPDQVIVGNVMTRGHEVIESLLDSNIPFTSGPQWLYENILREKYVIAVTGTHGKTTTTSMLSWILEDNNYRPSFLIGGAPRNFNSSARLTNSEFFVIEGDEYDSAFFDKRPKFIHYHPKISIINNIEFDHADIYKNLKEIIFQFHQLIRLVPSNGKIIYNGDDKNTADLIDFGHWCNTESYGSQSDCEWKADIISKNNIEIHHKDFDHYSSDWLLKGSYNKENALSAIIAANTIGISPDKSLDSLKRFSGVKRRFELLGNFNGLIIFDDFAHHPTSIKKTLDDIVGLYPGKNISVSVEMLSNTMRQGIHNDHLLGYLKSLDHVTFLSSNAIVSQIRSHTDFNNETMHVFDSPDDLTSHLFSMFNSDVVHVFLSNGDFMGAKEAVMSRLRKE